MTFQDYQKLAGLTAIYPLRGNNLLYPLLGFVGETGEVCEKLKKIIRDQDNPNLILTESQRNELIKEFGDILWYYSELLTHFSISMDEVAERNIDKLNSRKIAGTLNGSGDDR